MKLILAPQKLVQVATFIAATAAAQALGCYRESGEEWSVREAVLGSGGVKGA